MWNYELGVKTPLLDGRMDLRTALFFQDRDEVQTGQSLVLPIEGEICPCQFIDFTTNATAGQSYGLEAELNWDLSRRIDLFASLGLLQSQFDDFLNFSHVDANPETGEPIWDSIHYWESTLLMLVGGILGGVFTATESACIAVLLPQVVRLPESNHG